MDNLFSISLIQEIQTWRATFLDRFFILCNWFDTAGFAILLILTVGIFINRKLGYRLALILTLGFLINKSLKYIFGMPRPLHIDPSLGILSASSPGFPSGAAQSSLLLCGILIKEWSSPLKWLAGPLYVIIISFSRMYLGLHFPGDIIGGWIAGIFLLSIYLSLTQQQYSKKNSTNVLQ